MNLAQKAFYNLHFHRGFHTTTRLQKVVMARYKKTPNRTNPLTYEMANKPHHIATRKSWNSWNTTSLIGGLREPETVVEDMFIRKFMTGTWHKCFVSEIIIKRQHNMIRIGGIIQATYTPTKMYFLIGYTEELLSYWLKGPVKLELQVVNSNEDVIYKYI